MKKNRVEREFVLKRLAFDLNYFRIGLVHSSSFGILEKKERFIDQSNRPWIS